MPSTESPEISLSLEIEWSSSCLCEYFHHASLGQVASKQVNDTLVWNYICLQKKKKVWQIPKKLASKTESMRWMFLELGLFMLVRIQPPRDPHKNSEILQYVKLAYLSQDFNSIFRSGGKYEKNSWYFPFRSQNKTGNTWCWWEGG